jgi:hypothetical protein
MEVDFTQWWVPAVTMVVLGTYVFYSGFQESRMPIPAAKTEEEVAAETATAEEASKSTPAKRGILARTSWIWGSVLIGAAAQAYLSYVAV